MIDLENALQLWKEQAEADPEYRPEWEQYFIFMSGLAAILQQVPLTQEECAAVSISTLLPQIMERLADTVSDLFPLGGLEEFRTYISGAAKARASSARMSARAERYTM